MTCKFFNKLASDGVSYLWERNELICFHSKRPFTETTLGVGLNLENKVSVYLLLLLLYQSLTENLLI